MSSRSDRLLQRLRPAQTNAYVRWLAVATVFVQMMIVVTGGLVRLTASGLGCNTWPQCKPGSFVPTPELGIHGVVEFTNRTLTFVLLAVGILTWLAVRNAGRLPLFILLGIPAQAIIGGISVLMRLNPWVVGLHFILSAVLIYWAVLMAVIVFRRPVTEEAHCHPALVRIITAAMAVVVVMGTVLTGSGPHAGDHGAKRNGLDSAVMTPFHTIGLYVLLIVLAIYLVRTSGKGLAFRRGLLVLAACLVQGAIGYIQHFTALPWWLVALHMLGATCVIATVSNLFAANVRRPQLQNFGEIQVGA